MIGYLFNMDHGYLEGVCRGFKNQLLQKQDYYNLTRCETLSDLRLNLECGSDICNLLENMSGDTTVSNIEEALKERFVKEFQYLLSQATGNLKIFLELITHSYMIDNIMLLII